MRSKGSENRGGRKRKKRARTGKVCISFMVVILAGILSIQIVRLYNREEEYKEQEELLAEQLADEEQRAEELERQQEYVGTDEYVEDVARAKLGMVYPDEILFKEE